MGQRRFRYRRWLWLMGFVLFLFLVKMVVALGEPEQPPIPVSSQPRTVFVHLFEWRWEDVAQECETFLGPGGFAAVQVSPPNEHAVVPEQGFPWWQRYQPVSYQLVSRSGDRAQFSNMVQRCKAVGVDIYADAVINHMAAVEGVGSAGTVYRRYHYPGLYEPKDFHTCQRDIQDYSDRTEVTTCELVGLPDLKTHSPTVQEKIVSYLADLVNLGVVGFRIDAAKHIAPADLAEILQKLEQQVPTMPYVYQEVIDPGTEATQKEDYYATGDVSEFEYGRIVSAALLGKDGYTLAQLATLGESWGLVPTEQAIAFIDNHDKQRGHAGGGDYLTYKDGKRYELAVVFMLAYPYGYPQIMSSYAFSDSEQGPPGDRLGNTRPVYENGVAQCFREWVCEHRNPAIAAMVRFRNATNSVFAVTDWWSNGNNQIAFSRGDRGFVVINAEAEPLTHTFQTQLPSGEYCNLLTGDRPHPSPDTPCSGQPITVDAQGKFTATVAAMEAIALQSPGA